MVILSMKGIIPAQMNRQANLSDCDFPQTQHSEKNCRQMALQKKIKEMKKNGNFCIHLRMVSRIFELTLAAC